MAKIQVRRGTLAQLNGLASGSYLDAGELGFTTDTGEVYVGTGVSNDVKHLIGQAIVDVFSNRPTAGVAGRLFHATDTDVTYVDDGTAWVDVSSGISDLDDITDGTTYGRVLNTDLSSNHVNQISDTTNTVTAAQARTHIDDADKHREINDSGSADTDLWSGSKITDEIANVVSGIDPQESVLDQSDLTGTTLSPSTGDRYINTVSGTATDGGGTVQLDNIYEWDGAAWDETVVSEGMHTWDETADAAYVYTTNPTDGWVKFGTTVTHNNLAGLNNDDYKHLTATEYGGLHAESHTVVSHSDTTATGSELDELTDGSTTSLHNHANDHAESHNIASHNDTTATGSELDTLTDGSETTLHSHALPANDHVAATVTDTTSIDLTITGQEISADLLVADGGTFV